MEIIKHDNRELTPNAVPITMSQLAVHSTKCMVVTAYCTVPLNHNKSVQGTNYLIAKIKYPISLSNPLGSQATLTLFFFFNFKNI